MIFQNQVAADQIGIRVRAIAKNSKLLARQGSSNVVIGRVVDGLPRFQGQLHSHTRIGVWLRHSARNPFVPLLIVPEAFGRCVAVRDDPLYANAGGVEQSSEKLVRQIGRKVGEEVGGRQIRGHSVPSRSKYSASPFSKVAIASASELHLPSSKISPP